MTVALMYHDLVSTGASRDDDASGFPGRDAALYKITFEQFESHLRALGDSGTVREAPTMTFDDGGASAMRAADALERRGWIGHFFVTTDYIGAPGFVARSDIRELGGRGHVIGSHSCSHPLRMGHCEWPRLLNEWTRSRATLEDALGAEVRTASVPGGDFTPTVARAAAAAGLARLFTSEPTAVVHQLRGLVLQGRFTIRRSTPTPTVVGLASGAWLAQARQGLSWNAKKLSKRLGGESYLKLRRMVLGDGGVRWGGSSDR